MAKRRHISDSDSDSDMDEYIVIDSTTETELLKENQELNKKLKDKSYFEKELTEKYEHLNEKCHQLENELKEKAISEKDLTKKYQLLNEDYNNVKTEFENKCRSEDNIQQEYKALEYRLQEMCKEKEGLNRTLSERDDQNLKLKTDLNGFTKLFDRYKQIKDKEINAINAEKEELTKGLDNSQNNNMQTEITEYKNINKTLTEERDKFKSENITLTEKLAKKERNCREIVNRSKGYLSKIEILSDEKEKLKHDLNKCMKNKDKYKKQFEESEKKCAETHNELLKVKKQRYYFENFNEKNVSYIISN